MMCETTPSTEPLKLSPFYSVQDGKLVLDNSFLNNPDYLSFKSSFDRARCFSTCALFSLCEG